MQTTKKPVNYHLVAILAIVAILVAGIWIFGFDDELFGTKTIKQTPIKQNQITQPLQQKPITQNPVFTENKYVETPTPEPKPTEKQAEPTERPIVLQSPRKDSDPINLLENATFELDVDGTAYEGSLSLSKSAEITLTLIPIKDTKLEKFDVSDGRIVIGNTAISFDKGTAEIKGTTILISVINDDSLDPFFTIVGTLDDPILSDKDSTQNVSFSDQLVYFGKKDETTPHHFDVSGELKH